MCPRPQADSSQEAVEPIHDQEGRPTFMEKWRIGDNGLSDEKWDDAVWVQCEDCEKWRLADKEIEKEYENKKFTCSDLERRGRGENGTKALTNVTD